MNLLLDTQVLIWSALNDSRLSGAARELIESPENALWFSAVSLWEVAIKYALGRPDFQIQPGPLRSGLLANQYTELPLEGRHVLALQSLPPLHRDPFDRILLAQTVTEGMVLLTADRSLSSYKGPIKLI